MSRDFQTAFKKLIGNTLSPSLKALGFKKSGYNYYRISEDVIQVCNVQRSQFNHETNQRFTLNFGFIVPKIHTIMTNDKPLSKFPNVDESYVWGRSGHLIYGKDYWYELRYDDGFEKLSIQLENDINNHLLSIFNDIKTIDSLLALLRKSVKERNYHIIARDDFVAVLECEFGSKNSGKKILLDNYKEAIIPKATQSKHIYPDGREVVSWSEPSVNKYYIEFLKRVAQHYQIELP